MIGDARKRNRNFAFLCLREDNEDNFHICWDISFFRIQSHAPRIYQFFMGKKRGQQKKKLEAVNINLLGKCKWM